MISNKQLEKFKDIYKRNFDKDISDQEALKKATKLLRLVEIIYKPMTQEEYNQVQKHRRKDKESKDKESIKQNKNLF